MHPYFLLFFSPFLTLLVLLLLVLLLLLLLLLSLLSLLLLLLSSLLFIIATACFPLAIFILNILHTDKHASKSDHYDIISPAFDDMYFKTISSFYN